MFWQITSSLKLMKIRNWTKSLYTSMLSVKIDKSRTSQGLHDQFGVREGYLDIRSWFISIISIEAKSDSIRIQWLHDREIHISIHKTILTHSLRTPCQTKCLSARFRRPHQSLGYDAQQNKEKSIENNKLEKKLWFGYLFP